MLLEKKVHAINEVNRIAILNFNHVYSILEQFVEQKILLASGSKSAKFKTALDFLNEQPKGFGKDYARLHRVMLDISTYSVWVNVSCSFKDTDSSCFYQDKSIHIGIMKNGILESIEGDKLKFKPYNVQEVRTLLNEKKRLNDELSTIKSKLHEFDGYYN